MANIRHTCPSESALFINDNGETIHIKETIFYEAVLGKKIPSCATRSLCRNEPTGKAGVISGTGLINTGQASIAHKYFLSGVGCLRQVCCVSNLATKQKMGPKTA